MWLCYTSSMYFFVVVLFNCVTMTLMFYLLFLRYKSFLLTGISYITHIGGAIVSMLTSSVVYSGVKFLSGKTKDYYIGIFCFFVKYAVFWGKSKDWFSQNQVYVSK